MCNRNYYIKAIIYDKRKRIISIGENSYIKTHPYMAKLSKKHNDPEKIYIHAEIAAIIKCKDLKKAHTITVIRVNSLGQLRLAKPCPMCMEAIEIAGIKNINYSVNDNLHIVK